MRLLAATRFNRLRAHRLVAVMFAIGWLGFAVTPCQAMPHQQLGSSDHGSMPAGGCGGCPDAPAGLDNGCGLVAAPECLSMGLAILESRGSGIPQPAAGPPPALPGFDAFVPDGGSLRDVRVHRLPVSRVSLQKRYCSYLN